MKNSQKDIKNFDDLRINIKVIYILFLKLSLFCNCKFFNLDKINKNNLQFHY